MRPDFKINGPFCDSCSEKESEHILVGESLEYAKMYVDAANRNTSRCNWSYACLLIVCVTALMALYNEYWSFGERFIKATKIVRTPEVYDEYLKAIVAYGGYNTADSIHYSRFHEQVKDGSNLDQMLLANLVRNWVDTQYFTFPILGLKISTADVTSVLSLCIIIILIWCFFCIRSENFTLGKILNATQTHPLYFKRYILYGICFKNLFYPVTLRNKPYLSLSGTYLGGVSVKAANVQDKGRNYNTWYNRISKRYFSYIILFLLPFVVVVAHLVCLSSEMGNYTSSFSQLDFVKEIHNNGLNPEDVKNYYNNGCEVKKTAETAVPVLHLNTEKIYRMNMPHGIYGVTENYVHYGRSIMWITIFSLACLFAVCFLIYKIIRFLYSTNRILYQYKYQIKCEEEFRDLVEQLKIRKNEYTALEAIRIDEIPDSKFKCDDTNMVFGFSVYDTNCVGNIIRNIKSNCVHKCCSKDACGNMICQNILNALEKINDATGSKRWFSIIFKLINDSLEK